MSLKEKKPVGTEKSGGLEKPPEREKKTGNEEEILSDVQKVLRNGEAGGVSDEASSVSVQVVPVPDEAVLTKLDEIGLCLVVLICAVGCVCGLLVGSIMWGRFRK